MSSRYSRNLSRFLWVVVAIALPGTVIRAESITIVASADTTLIEGAPDNNLGAQPFFNVGTTEHFSRNRGIFRFDLNLLPRNSTLLSATLTLQVVHEPSNGFEPSEMELHRLLQPWGEGEKSTLVSPGLGQPATTSEATWNSPFALTGTTWAQPGGSSGLDYVTTMSDSVFVYGIADSPYQFSSTNLLQDLQAWINNPGTNFGWMLLTAAEQSPFTARRFGSREDPDSAPALQLEYRSPLVLQQPRFQETTFQFRFDATAGKSYVGESATELAPASIRWQPFTNLTVQSSGPIIFTNATLGPIGFYRVREE